MNMQQKNRFAKRLTLIANAKCRQFGQNIDGKYVNFTDTPMITNYRKTRRHLVFKQHLDDMVMPTKATRATVLAKLSGETEYHYMAGRSSNNYENKRCSTSTSLSPDYKDLFPVIGIQIGLETIERECRDMKQNNEQVCIRIMEDCEQIIDKNTFETEASDVDAIMKAFEDKIYTVNADDCGEEVNYG